MEGSKVSVIMNCHNGDKYLSEALESVINQEYKNWELIFWDNQSSDTSAEIVKKYSKSDERIKYFLSNKFTNLGLARKKAVEKAEGEIIAFLDTDDLWMKNKLSSQINLFNDPEVGMVISNTIFFNKNNEKILYQKSPPQGHVFNDLCRKYFISLETLLLRKFYLEKYNITFDENFNHNCDFELVTRLSRFSKLSYCNKTLSKWRVHSNNATLNSGYAFIEEQKMIVKKLKYQTLNDIDKSSIKHLERKIYFSELYYNIMSKKKFIHTLKFIILSKSHLIEKFYSFLVLFFPFNYLVLKYL